MLPNTGLDTPHVCVMDRSLIHPRNTFLLHASRNIYKARSEELRRVPDLPPGLRRTLLSFHVHNIYIVSDIHTHMQARIHLCT